jgi:hypothetical protein
MTEERIIAVAFPSLFKATRQFARDFLGALRAVAGDPPQWPQGNFFDITVREVGGTGIGMVQRNDYGQTLRAAWLQVSVLESRKTVSDELEKLKTEGRTVGYWLDDLVAGFVFPILRKYVIAHPSGGPFDEGSFEKLYGEVESYLAVADVAVLVFLDLVNLTLDQSPLILDPNRRIVKLDPETTRRLLERWYGAELPINTDTHFIRAFGRTSGANAQVGQTVLEVTVRYPKEKFNELSVIMSSAANEAATALRLSLPGTGNVQMLDYEHLGFVPEFGRYGHGEQRSSVNFRYRLDDATARVLTRRWPDSAWVASRLFASPSSLSAPLRIAIQRFNASFERIVQTDRLLDFIIALEALCSKEPDAVSYRVALRAVALAGRDAAERDTLFKLLTNAYTERSSLAHGRGSKLEGDEAVREYLFKLEEVLLRTVHAFIAAELREQAKDDVLRIIDRTVRTQDRSELESELATIY